MSTTFPDDENGDVLRRMQQGGDDLSVARNIDFSIVFPDRAAAQEFVRQAKKAGFRTSVESPSGEESFWEVTATKHLVPIHATITDIEAGFEELASPLGGRNDGWGCWHQITTH